MNQRLEKRFLLSFSVQGDKLRICQWQSTSTSDFKTCIHTEKSEKCSWRDRVTQDHLVRESNYRGGVDIALRIKDSVSGVRGIHGLEELLRYGIL